MHAISLYLPHISHAWARSCDLPVSPTRLACVLTYGVHASPAAKPRYLAALANVSLEALLLEVRLSPDRAWPILLSLPAKAPKMLLSLRAKALKLRAQSLAWQAAAGPFLGDDAVHPIFCDDLFMHLTVDTSEAARASCVGA